MTKTDAVANSKAIAVRNQLSILQFRKQVYFVVEGKLFKNSARKIIGKFSDILVTFVILSHFSELMVHFYCPHFQLIEKVSNFYAEFGYYLKLCYHSFDVK